MGSSHFQTVHIPGGNKQARMGEHTNIRLQGTTPDRRHVLVHVDSRRGRHSGRRLAAASAGHCRLQPEPRLVCRAASEVLQVS